MLLIHYTIVFKGKQVVDYKKLTPIDVDTVYSKRKKNGYMVNERFRDKIRMAELDDAIYKENYEKV